MRLHIMDYWEHILQIVNYKILQLDLGIGSKIIKWIARFKIVNPNGGNVADRNAMELEGAFNIEFFVTPSYAHLYNML